MLGDLRVWGRDGTPRAHRPKKGIEVAGSVAIRPGGDSVIVTLGATQTVVQEFDLGLSPLGKPYEGHLGRITGLAFSPSGQLVTGGEGGTIRLWTLPSREVQEIAVGLPIDQFGFWRDLLWVRADGEWLFFYERTGSLLATILLDPDGLVSFTPGGCYAAPSPRGRALNLYGESGQLLSSEEVPSRRSPERVMKAIVDRALK